MKKNLQVKKLPLKAILILENAPSHPKAGDLNNGDIREDFLIANLTSVIQPLDQGVLGDIQKLKPTSFVVKVASINVASAR